MVQSTRATTDTRRIRRLKQPRAIEVESDENGAPLRLLLSGGWLEVSHVRRPWRVDQHWWRSDPIKRDYFRVATHDGPPLTLFHDRLSDEWFRQEY